MLTSIAATVKASPIPARRRTRLLSLSSAVLMLAAACGATRADALEGAPGRAADGAAGASLDTTAQRARPCEACHGAQGRATPDGWYPRIAGKPAGYLFHQLQNFRSGHRHNAAMAYMVDYQRDEFLQELADHFAVQELPYPAPTHRESDAAVLERGRRLVHEGDAAQELPACESCHGERLTGLTPDVPGLLGLPYDYLVAQFGAWQTGSRRTVEPDCMGAIARHLAPADVAAVAAYLATTPVPADAHAAGQTAALPRACGSVRALP